VVEGHADPVAIPVEPPSRAMVSRPRHAIADECTGTAANERAGDRSPSAASYGGADKSACAGAQSAADQRAALLLGRLAPRERHRDGERQRKSKRDCFLHHGLDDSFNKSSPTRARFKTVRGARSPF
jgi:hypothetical protein